MVGCLRRLSPELQNVWALWQLPSFPYVAYILSLAFFRIILASSGPVVSIFVLVSVSPSTKSTCRLPLDSFAKSTTLQALRLHRSIHFFPPFHFFSHHLFIVRLSSIHLLLCPQHHIFPLCFACDQYLYLPFHPRIEHVRYGAILDGRESQ
jgi:hypothetical protein